MVGACCSSGVGMAWDSPENSHRLENGLRMASEWRKKGLRMASEWPQNGRKMA
jgi:hypothetical protein